MKRYLALLCLLALTLRAEVEFSGYLIIAKERLVQITDLEDRRSFAMMR